MEQVIGLLLFELLVMIVFAIILLHKIRRIDRRIATVVKTVEDYLTVVMEEEVPEDGETVPSYGKTTRNIVHNYEKEHETEAQSRLISAVLQEIFP